jgi:hypothetical protein
LGCAGVEPLVLAGRVVVPVLAEVTVGYDGTQGEDGFGALESHLASVMSRRLGQVAAGSFDDPGGDEPARCKRLVVAQVVVLAGEVADARVDPGALIAGQDRERLDRAPLLGCRVPAWRRDRAGFLMYSSRWIRSITM